MDRKSGRFKGVYKGCSNALVAVAGVAPFWVLSGGSNNLVKLKRIRISGVTTTAVGYQSLVVTKYSTAHSAGTPAAVTKVPLKSEYPASDVATCQGYTAAPTAGTAVGEIASKRFISQATTAAAAGIPQEHVFEFDDVVLDGAAESIALRFSSAPATAATLNVEAEWEEYSKA